MDYRYTLLLLAIFGVQRRFSNEEASREFSSGIRIKSAHWRTIDADMEKM